MPKSISTFLMFDGVAADALALYVTLFPESAPQLTRYGESEQAMAGKIQRAELTLAGHALILMDSPTQHAFTFTPATSLFIDCVDEAEFERLVAGLGEGGTHLMPPGDYGFSRKFAWLNDRFGVSWQVNLV